MNDHSAIEIRSGNGAVRLNRTRAIYHLAKADFLERLRRISFLVTLAATTYFGYLAWKGQIHLSTHGYTGVANSAWTGTLLSIVASTFLSLCGFYVVRQTVERDRQTRVGPILATTPISSFEYLLGKFLSNLAVLSAMLGVLAVAAIIWQVLRHEGGSFEFVSLVAPFLLIAFPAMALVAAVAVLFDVTPGLRSGAGNIVYFFSWIFGLSASVEFWKNSGAGTFTDPVGMATVEKQLGRAALAAGADPKNGEFALNVGPAGSHNLKPFLWHGMEWTTSIVAGRLFWLAVAVAVVLIASKLFHRFDPAYETIRIRRRNGKEQQEEELNSVVATNAPQFAWRNLTAARRGSSVWLLVVSELRLVLRGRQWWMKLGAAGVIIAGLASPVPAIPLIIAAVLPVLVISQLGCREPRYDTATLVYNSPISGATHVLAAWMAGTLTVLALFSGALLRMAIFRDPHFVGAIVGACFMAALAVCFGSVSGGSKLFEAVYIAWWYVGPLNAAPGMDFVGVTAGAAPAHFAIYTLVLLTTAIAGRAMRQRWAV